MPRLVSKRLMGQIQRRTRDNAYGDKGRIIYREDAGTRDALNNKIVDERDGALIDCSFSWRKKDEKWTATKDLKEWDAEVRIDQNNHVTGNDAFEIFERFDTPQQSSFKFEIVDIDNRAGFGYVLRLLQVKP